MSWYTAKAEHIGGRTEQQDRVEFFSSSDNETHLLALADGMGGHQGGALAAQAVMDAAHNTWNYFQNKKPLEPYRLLQQICFDAHSGIRTINQNQQIYPHSTCVLLYVQDGRAWWTHLGDSRLYHFRNGRFFERTRDHSVVQMLFEMGKIREDEMATHRDQGRLLKGLSGEEAPEIECSDIETLPDDLFLLCSDGLWEQFDADELCDNLHEIASVDQDTLREKVKHIVDTAAQRGGRFSDNISLAVAWRKT